MQGLKEIRTRISSIESTQKITAAMKLISAAKLRKAQDSLEDYHNYSEKMQHAMELIASSIKPDSPYYNKWFQQPSQINSAALVIITSNSSMCGGFNLNLIKAVNENLIPQIDYNWKENAEIYSLGRKGTDFFKKNGYNIVYDDMELVNKPNFKDSTDFITTLIQKFLDREYEAVFVAFNEFINPAVQKPCITRLLPFKKPENSIKRDYLIVEPNEHYLIEKLVPLTIETVFYEIILKNAAGEHGARMTSMHQATENAMELTKELKLLYNKARQAAITNEILEIVSGAEALKG